MKFKLNADYQPTGDQPDAIDKLVRNCQNGLNEQVLVGVTGSGKTFTMANVIARLQRPTLILSHNKTLAAQLYQEFRDYFPENAVSYFVSYYDYYQPEAYIPHTDTYIEKTTEINEEIDKMRLAATTNILTRKDTIIIASVSCIYNIGSPREYGHFVLELEPGIKIERNSILERLVQLQYERSDYGFHRSTFRVRGETIDIFPAYDDKAIRIIFSGNIIKSLQKLDPLSGKFIETLPFSLIYPAKHYMTDPAHHKEVFNQIKADLDLQVQKFQKSGKIIEAHRIAQRVNYDLEMIAEMGYVNGIENYSRYFDGRAVGDSPYTLFDYYKESVGSGKDKFLLFIDESHMSVPQVRGMYNGDRSRKQTLIDYGFRLPAALDNRPMRFDEFERVMPQTIYVSATPNEWEIERAKTSALQLKLEAKDGVIEQLLRPTGLVDPEVEIRPIETQIADLTREINIRVTKHERVLVTTLTKRMAEDLTKHLESLSIKAHFLHSDVLTLKRSDILADLRSGIYDVIIGVNLLREGLDLPEVSLVAILDADKEGFLRSQTSLIQTMGRAARHVSGQVILYADNITKSIEASVLEVKRRREIQIKYNTIHNISPQSIQKPIRAKLIESIIGNEIEISTDLDLNETVINKLTPFDQKKLLNKLKQEMRSASRDLRFEEAAQIRDLINKIESLK
jgi:excinuclease ABC subunit B